MKVSLHVNDETHEVEAPPGMSLADVLRDTLAFTGVKRGCDSGGCGMCTVLLDGKIIFSCMTPFWRAENKKVLTIEGVEKDGKLDEIQESFVRNSSAQCGYCTPAMVLATKAILASNPHPSEEEIRNGLSGVLCRCTGYQPYIQAILEIANKKGIR